MRTCWIFVLLISSLFQACLFDRSPKQAVLQPKTPWDIQFHGPFAPLDSLKAQGIQIVERDLFDTDTLWIRQAHQSQIKVVCYLNAGAYEDWRPDTALFPSQVLGLNYQGWPGEKWLDIRDTGALGPVMRGRMELAKVKGCDAVEPDNVNGWDNTTGFDLSAQNQIIYNRWLAQLAHTQGLAIVLKNNPLQAVELEPYFDAILVESCVAHGWCELTAPFRTKKKPIFAIEYLEEGAVLDSVCAQAQKHGLEALIKKRDLGSWSQRCP